VQGSAVTELSNNLTAMQAWAAIFQGWGQATQRQIEEGIAQMRAGIENWRAMDAVSSCSFLVIPLVEVYRQAGQVEQGLSTLKGRPW
jgi:predicted ATPase